MLIGHQRIENFFAGAIQHKTLSHAYGFIGPSGLGKRTFTRQIASQLLLVVEEKLPIHPDFIYVERGEDEKTGKLKKFISVAEAREIRNRLQHTSFSNGYRVVVINEAELLNNEAANSLLKILEEPPKNTIFFLLIENETNLPPTIKSRLQNFYFLPVKTVEISEGLKALGTASDAADLCAARSLGRPGRAVQLLQTEISEKYSADLALFESLLDAPLYKKIENIEGLYGDADDGERGRTEWQKTMDGWISWFRSLLLQQYGISKDQDLKTNSNYSATELLNIIDSLQKLKQLLRQNAHPRLAIEATLLKF